MLRLERMWVNQPLSSQLYHQYHGMNVLALPINGVECEVWFTSGDTHAINLPKLILSVGWLKNPKLEHDE